MELNKHKIITLPICFKCKHLKGKGYSCAAFDEIPDEILFGENDHSEPLPDQDNDIVFEEDAKEEDL